MLLLKLTYHLLLISLKIIFKNLFLCEKRFKKISFSPRVIRILAAEVGTLK